MLVASCDCTVFAELLVGTGCIWQGFVMLVQPDPFTCYCILQVVMSKNIAYLGCNLLLLAVSPQYFLQSCTGYLHPPCCRAACCGCRIRASLQRGLGGLREVFLVFRPQITLLSKLAYSMRFSLTKGLHCMVRLE